MPFADLFKSIVLAGRSPLHPLLAHNHQRFAGDREYHGLLEEYEFVVLDTELTGFSRKQDEIVAIGAVRIRGLRIICGETFYAVVRPDGRFQTQSTLVHRLTPQELHKAEGLREILPGFIEFCGDAFLVGHCVRLDLEFINRAAQRLMGGNLITPYLDTMGLAMAYHDLQDGVYRDHDNRQGDYTLAGLSKEYGLPPFQEHNALKDALQTAYLFLYLVKKMRNHGILTMSEFLVAGRGRNSSWWSL
jgi:DNA polymerase-3 subunit epsilon